MIDTHELTTTDHLFTEPWVNEFGRDAIMMQPAVYRNTFTTHPKNQTPLPFRLVVCHENHDRSRKNYLLSALGSDIARFGNIFVPYGNILVLKTKTDDPTNIIDVNSSDIDLIMDVVLRWAICNDQRVRKELSNHDLAHIVPKHYKEPESKSNQHGKICSNMLILHRRQAVLYFRDVMYDIARLKIN